MDLCYLYPPSCGFGVVGLRQYEVFSQTITIRGCEQTAIKNVINNVQEIISCFHLFQIYWQEIVISIHTKLHFKNSDVDRNYQCFLPKKCSLQLDLQNLLTEKQHTLQIQMLLFLYKYKQHK